jgi:hypothetical protein
MIAGKTVPRDPKENKRRQQNAEPKLVALQRRRPLEIVQINPLGQFLGCAYSRHSSP